MKAGIVASSVATVPKEEDTICTAELFSPQIQNTNAYFEQFSSGPLSGASGGILGETMLTTPETGSNHTASYNEIDSTRPRRTSRRTQPVMRLFKLT